ncbi:MAG: HD domain-containing protein [Candidatus Peregrinibacteria bacterium]
MAILPSIRASFLSSCLWDCANPGPEADRTVINNVPEPSLLFGEYFSTFREAIDFARIMHEGQRRLDGLPFLSHPIAVLQIVLSASKRLPRSAYVSAILHDVLEDGPTSREEIAEIFGERTAEIVAAVTRPRSPHRRFVLLHEAAYLMQMRRATVRNPAVLLVKMADRLHNLRTSEFLPRERRAALIEQTAELYLPLLHAMTPREAPFAAAHTKLLRMLEEELARQRGGGRV